MIWRATVLEALAAGPVVTIPRRYRDRPVGPLPTAVAGLAPGDRVLVAEVDGLVDQFVVIARLT